MDKPDSQQRGLAGEYYVASMICRMGYDVGITIGRAKIFDMVALGSSGITISGCYGATACSNKRRRKLESTGNNSFV